MVHKSEVVSICILQDMKNHTYPIEMYSFLNFKHALETTTFSYAFQRVFAKLL
jgi:hypothetical protein